MRASREKRLGQDELNLVNLPLAVLSDRTAHQEESLVREFVVGDQRWQVRADPEYGAPAPMDMEVFVCLLELAREKGNARRLAFTFHELLLRLGWSRSASRYDRLRLALK